MYPQALKNAELRKLFFSQLPADFADWLDFVAIGALLAFVWDAPSFAYALLAVGMGAPYLVIGPFAGGSMVYQVCPDLEQSWPGPDDFRVFLCG